MKYDWEFKMKCVEKYMEGGWIEKPDNDYISDRTFRDYITEWTRIYKLYGYDGLQLRKGRKPKEEAMKDKPEELTLSEKEELVLLRRQNEYLKAENAYLKKMKALIVQKKAESSVKAKKQRLPENSEDKDTD